MMFFFFFKQKTAYEMRISDWSSDVCSSDLLDLGRQLDDDRALLRGHSAIGRTAFGLGDFTEARRHLEQAIALNEAERPAGGSEADRPDSAVTDLCYLSWTSFSLGAPPTPLAQSRRSLGQPGRAPRRDSEWAAAC